ncbi:MAG: beta-N-acetylhexosaminidase [Cellulosilyticaceae bacterium]
MEKLRKLNWKKNIVLLVALMIVVFCIALVFKSKSKHLIIPKPLSYEAKNGEFVLAKDTAIYINGKSEEETKNIYSIARLLKTKLQPSTGYKLDIIQSNQVPEGSIYLTTFDGVASQGNEGYTITVNNNRVKIVAYEAQGLVRGIQTLRQLFPADIEKNKIVTNTKWSISNCTIEDRPEYSYRGLMIDVARHFVPIEELKRQIDLAAYYKINKVHLHLSDDQGWRLEIKKWPDLTAIGASTCVNGGNGGYYTQEEFKDIIHYASERYMEIIPEFDMPGHINAALASYGFLNPDGNKKPLYTGIKVGFSTLMCRDEKTYRWIEDVIKEVSALSPSPYIHIGGDEPNSTKDEDYRYFIGRICKIAQKYGKIPIGWDPCDTAIVSDSNLILQNWSNNNTEAKNKKMKMIISRAGKTYLDMKYDEKTPYGLTWAGYNPIKDSYSWDPTQYAPKELILGIEAPVWTENIDKRESMDYMIYPRLLGHAEIGWTPKDARDFREYTRRLVAHGERMKNQGISYYHDKNIWK